MKRFPSPHSPTTKQYRAFVLTVVADLKRFTIGGTERRATRRARALFTRGQRNSRAHACDLALQAMSDAPHHLEYGHDEMSSYLFGSLPGTERLEDPAWKTIFAIVSGEEGPTDI